MSVDTVIMTRYYKHSDITIPLLLSDLVYGPRQSEGRVIQMYPVTNFKGGCQEEKFERRLHYSNVGRQKGKGQE